MDSGESVEPITQADSSGRGSAHGASRARAVQRSGLVATSAIASGVVLSVAITATTLGGCADEDCETTSTCAGSSPVGGDGDGGGNGADALGDVDPITGKPHKGFLIDPIGPQPRVMHDSALTVRVTINRAPGNEDDVVLTVANLPAGVTVDPFTIIGSESTGELVVNVAGTAKQGPFDVVVQGASKSDNASTKLSLFVRGKPGTIDTTFGTSGRQSLLGGVIVDKPAEILVGPNDEIYVVAECTGTFSRTCVGRLSADGTVDATYGGANAAMDLRNPQAAILDGAGRLIVAGGAPVPALGRFNANGQPDASFGVVFLDTGLAAEFKPASAVSDLALCPGGAFYAAFHAGSSMGFRRFTSAGANDTQFSGDGFVDFTWGPNSNATGIVCETNGFLRVAGTYNSGIGIARFTNTGVLDSGFATGGYKTVGITPGLPLEGAFHLLPDGRSVAGFLSDMTAPIVMFASNGNGLHTAFAGGGIANIPLGTGTLTGLAIQKDEKILGAIHDPGADRLIRVDAATGTLDPGFDTDGEVRIPLDQAWTGRVAIQSDGRILLASYDNSTAQSVYVTRIWD